MKDLVNDYFNGTIRTMKAEDFGNITNIRDYALYSSFTTADDGWTGLNSFVIPNTVETIGTFAFHASKPQEIIIPDSVKVIKERAFYNCRTARTITIGSSVSKIEKLVFGTSAQSLAYNTVTFRQPAGMTITLPTAGDNGMFYCKKAYSITVYTDNETIKNYKWASDNVTATFKHLDGSDWA